MCWFLTETTVHDEQKRKLCTGQVSKTLSVDYTFKCYVYAQSAAFALKLKLSVLYSNKANDFIPKTRHASCVQKLLVLYSLFNT